MKTIIYLIILIICLVLATACEQQDVLRYDPNRAAIEFPAGVTGNTIGSSTFSFRTLPPGQTEHILSIPFNIVGFPASVDRNAVIIVLADSTTATSEQFEILSTTVPANSFQGQLRVRVINNQGADFEPVRIWFSTVRGGDFPYPGQSAPGFNNRILHLTNGLVRPWEWAADGSGAVGTRLGAYSSAFYQFIISNLGIDRFPFSTPVARVYFPAFGYNEDASGNIRAWTPSEGTLVLLAIMRAIEDYNRENYPDVLLHDDGHAAGYPVIVGERYVNLL